MVEERSPLARALAMVDVVAVDEGRAAGNLDMEETGRRIRCAGPDSAKPLEAWGCSILGLPCGNMCWRMLCSFEEPIDDCSSAGKDYIICRVCC